MPYRRIEDVVHAERSRDALRSRRIHFLKQDYVSTSQRCIRPEQSNRAVDSPRKGDVEGYDSEDA